MDFKTRRKLYKSGKQWVISTIFSAAVFSGMIFSSQPVTIHADSTPSITNSSSAASIDSAQVARDQAIASAATSQSAALSANSAAVEAVNDRLETAQNNYNEAVANAPEVTKTVAANQQAATGSDDWNQLTTTEQNAIQAIVTTPGNEYYQSSYPAELAGMYPTITIGENSTNVFKDGVTTNIVGSVDQLPLTFYPGILQYDPTNDTSATVSGQLTRDQVIELNDLSNTWMNWMRNYIYNTLGWTIQSATSDEKYSKDDFQTADNQLLTLSSHLDYFNEAQNVAAERSAEQLGYQHSVNLKGLDGSGFRRGSQYTYRAMANDRQLTANKSSYAGENLYEISGKTMLQLEVDLYNKMQAMLWSEVLQETPDSTSEHPAYYNSEASLATQYVDDDTYYVIWEFAGIKNGQALTDNGKETVSSGIIDQIKQATSPTSKTYIDYTGDNIVAAQEALTAARQNAQSELSTLEATAAQINQDYVSAVQAANETYNLALATATEQLNQASNATNNDSVLSSTPVTAIPTDDDTATPVSDNSSVSDPVSENTTASASEEISQSTAESASMTTNFTSVNLATTNSTTASTVLTSATSTSNSVVTATSTSTNQTSNNSVESTSTASSEMVSHDPVQSTASSTVASTANQLSQMNVISASTASLVSETTPVTSTSQAPHILPATATKATNLVPLSATNTTASTQKATNESHKNTTLPQTGNQSTTVFAFLMAGLTSFLSLIGLRRLK